MTTIGGLESRASRAGSPLLDAPVGESPEHRGHHETGRNLVAAIMIGLAGIAVLAGMFVALGFAIRGPLDPVRHWDATVGRWFFEQRTGTGNDLSHFGTLLAETPVVVAISLVVALVLAWRRRFHDVALLVGAMLVEIGTYLVVVLAVDRPRPAHQLEARFTGSYPSGHVAAAIALYGLLAYFVARRLRSRVGRAVVYCVPLLIAAAVATSRLYREMHHFSDVVAGVLIGAGALVVATRLARRVDNGERSPDQEVAS